MDPRHPEDAIWRMDQLLTQFKVILDKLRLGTTSSELGGAEREGTLVVQEICLVAPRLHEAMMVVSRTRRAAISHGLLEEPMKKEEESTLVPPSVEEFIEKQKKPKHKTTKKKKVEE